MSKRRRSRLRSKIARRRFSTPGIGWRVGRPHVTCPYPDHHDGDPSWRWDSPKARAYCTCIDGSDSALDVLMKCQGIRLRDGEDPRRRDDRPHRFNSHPGRKRKRTSPSSDRRGEPVERTARRPRRHLADRLPRPPPRRDPGCRAASEHARHRRESPGLLRRSTAAIEGEAEAGRHLSLRRVRHRRRRRPDACAPN